MRKLCLTGVLLVFIPMLLYGERMVVHLSDGTTAEFQVQEIEQITFDRVSNEDIVAFMSKVPIRFLTNYPNPFNPTTFIRFELSDPVMTEVTIYNVKGQVVKKLAHESMNSGVHELLWNGMNDSGRKCASGVYFYRVKCNDQIKINKMLMLK